MLNANNKVNYEPSIKQKEKKYSLSTVLAWLYLKTIGRILPGRWNQWAKNILYYNKIIADNGVQTDDLLNSNREKELKDENERLKEKLKEGIVFSKMDDKVPLWYYQPKAVSLYIYT